MEEATKDIYKVGKTLNYAGFKGVRFLRKEMIKGTEHVVMLDSFGNEKKVYTDLFEKYARVEG